MANISKKALGGLVELAAEIKNDPQPVQLKRISRGLICEARRSQSGRRYVVLISKITGQRYQVDTESGIRDDDGIYYWCRLLPKGILPQEFKQAA